VTIKPGNKPLAICPRCAAWAHNPCGFCGEPWPAGVRGYTPRGELSAAGRAWYAGSRAAHAEHIATGEPRSGAVSDETGIPCAVGTVPE